MKGKVERGKEPCLRRGVVLMLGFVHVYILK